MLPRIKSELLEGINHLLQFSTKGRENFPEQICNFLTQHFEFQSSVLFKISKGNNLTVLGKSDTARKNYLRGSNFTCSVCKALNSDSAFLIFSDSNCELQISEYVIYERPKTQWTNQLLTPIPIVIYDETASRLGTYSFGVLEVITYA